MNDVFAVLMLMVWAMAFGCVGGFAYACGCALNEIVDGGVTARCARWVSVSERRCYGSQSVDSPPAQGRMEFVPSLPECGDTPRDGGSFESYRMINCLLWSYHATTEAGR
ncbi:hypothetical protein [Stieleria varia]|uniref:Uncharacterized protein n=1 Tax=Stieleria varia TaxID=2528005 RepID=A0A5C6B5M2_9BACT|nr:hypothetical protein [Stieleria varia]TWU07585.1 hypothetical protein Pla52n_01580 [Stieleria varia]